MLIQASTPRVIFKPEVAPEYIKIHTLRRDGVSDGAVIFIGIVDPEHGEKASKILEPIQVAPIGIEDGFEAMEFCLPFREFLLLASEAATKFLPGVTSGPMRNEDGSRVLALPMEARQAKFNDVGIARFLASGINVTIRSAFRAEPRKYEERVLSFHITCNVTGGGVLRPADSWYDIVMPSFNPKAATPMPLTVPEEDFAIAYNRAHQGTVARDEEAERRRKERIAMFEKSVITIEAEQPVLALPEEEKSNGN